MPNSTFSVVQACEEFVLLEPLSSLDIDDDDDDVLEVVAPTYNVALFLLGEVDET